MSDKDPEESPSILVSKVASFISFCMKYFTLYRLLFQNNKNLIRRVEILTLFLCLLSLAMLFTVGYFPYWVAVIFCLLMAQRVIEFFLVYTQNFIFQKGIVFSKFYDRIHRGEWFMLMFGLSIFQVILAFSVWYRAISIHFPDAFNKHMEVVDCIYFTVSTFTTLGLGDVFPVGELPKALVLVQGLLTFFMIIIVFNGLNSVHFSKRDTK